jgi:hypothetical protein
MTEKEKIEDLLLMIKLYLNKNDLRKLAILSVDLQQKLQKYILENGNRKN